jgi:isoleucyl-tRNA synthetase
MYQNLVRSFDPTGPESVHHLDWPAAAPEQVETHLIEEMALVLRLVSLGHAARNQAGRKLRQPLSEGAFALHTPSEAEVLRRYARLIGEELNLKSVRELNKASEAVEFRLNPLPRQLGQKYGSRYPAIRQALLALEAETAAGRLTSGEAVEVRLGAQALAVLPDEVEVRIEPRQGFAAAADGPYVAALRTDLTPELVQEGMAREVIRRIQELRRQAGLEVSQRIEVEYHATPALASAIQAFGRQVEEEVLADRLDPAAGSLQDETFRFDGEELQLRLRPSSVGAHRVE